MNKEYTRNCPDCKKPIIYTGIWAKLRQQKIIDILHPKKFWRYDVVNKQCKNVIGE